MGKDRDLNGRTPLWRALQALSRGSGILRESLVEDLDSEVGELKELQKYWKINLDAGLRTVRHAVLSRLNDYMDDLEPRQARQRLALEDRKAQYLNAIRVSFHMVTNDDLRDLDLGGRRNWLASDARGKLRIAPSVSQEDLNHAISQIERQILDEYKKVKDVANTELEDSDASPGSLSIVVAPASERPEITVAGRSISWVRRKSIWLAASGVVVIGVAATIYAGATNQFMSNGTPPRTSSSNGQPVPVAMADGPVHVDNVAYERDGTGKSLGYSWVFPQKVQLSAADLASLNKLAGNSPAYQDWMLGRGGVNPDDASIQLTVRNKTGKPVVLTDVKVVKQCSNPLSGTLFFAREQGPVGDIHLALNLDEEFSVVKNQATGAGYFTGDDAHTIQLAPGETSTLLIDALTKQHYCQFHLNLIVDPEDGGSPISELVDNNGKPFAVTAVPEAGPYNDVKYSYYQALYAYYQDVNPADANQAGLGFGPVDPVTYPKG